MSKLIFTLSIIVLLNACHNIKPSNYSQTANDAAKPLSEDATWLCSHQVNLDNFAEFCHLTYWAEYIVDHADVKWAKRKLLIESLDDTPKSQLQQILLSQGQDTPYRYRLRAQSVITRLQPSIDPKMADMLEFMIFTPSQQILEYESAITILTRLNSEQSHDIKLLQDTVKLLEAEVATQRKQLKELLTIEADMVEQIE